METKNKYNPMNDIEKILFATFVVSFLIGFMIDIRFGFTNWYFYSIPLKLLGCIAIGIMIYKRNKGDIKYANM